MGAPEVQAAASADEHFSVDGTLLQACASHCPAGSGIDGAGGPTAPPSGPGEGFGTPKARQEAGQGGFPQSIKLRATRPHRFQRRIQDALLARKSNAHPAQPSYRGAPCSWTTAMPWIVDCRVTKKQRALENGMAPRRWRLTSRAHQKTLVPTKGTTHQGFVAEMRPHCRDAGPTSLRTHPPWLRSRHRWPPLHAMQGYAKFKSMPAGASRKLFLLDQTVGRPCAS